jgi:hypothetical protein
MRCSVTLLSIVLLILVGISAPPRSLAFSGPHSDPAKTKCKTVTKTVKGKKTRVKVCHKVKSTATPTPELTATPCLTLACHPASKLWKWIVAFTVSGPSDTIYTIEGSMCGSPLKDPWTVKYSYAYRSAGENAQPRTYYADGKTQLSLPLDTWVTFPLVTDNDYPNPGNIRVELQYNLHGRPAPASYVDQISPRVTLSAPYRTKGLALATAAAPVADCSPG